MNGEKCGRVLVKRTVYRPFSNGITKVAKFEQKGPVRGGNAIHVAVWVLNDALDHDWRTRDAGWLFHHRVSSFLPCTPLPARVLFDHDVVGRVGTQYVYEVFFPANALNVSCNPAAEVVPVAILSVLRAHVQDVRPRPADETVHTARFARHAAHRTYGIDAENAHNVAVRMFVEDRNLRCLSQRDRLFFFLHFIFVDDQTLVRKEELQFVYGLQNVAVAS